MRTFALLLLTLSLSGADDGWSKVIGLRSGTELRIVKRGSAQPVIARMDEADEERIIVVVKNEQTAIPKDVIDRLDARPTQSTPRLQPETKTTTTTELPGARHELPAPRSGGSQSTSYSSNVTIGSKPDFETVYRRVPAPARAAMPEPPPPSATVPYKTVGSHTLNLHIYNPAGHTPQERRAAIVFFFGGGWTNGTWKQFGPQSAALAARGMVAISADYRIRSLHDTTPFEAVADAQSAIQWVRANAATLGVDPGRIAAGGGSAGGHLAACAGVLPSPSGVSSRPDALVLFNPALDVAALVERLGPRASDISPLQHIAKGAPPAIIFHGTADTTVPFRQAEAFCDAMRGNGNRCELVPAEGEKHGFFNFGRGDGRWYKETLAAADRFLVSLGYLK